jgi:integrase
MALTKRGRYWHYDFIYRGKRHQGSTDQTNINKARLALAAIRSNAALEHVGVAPPKVSPRFQNFMQVRFREYVWRHAKKRSSALFYEEKGKRLLDSNLKDLRLSEIDGDAIEKYCDQRGSVAIATLNGELRTLRKAMKLAADWDLIKKAPKVRQLPGENEREFIVSVELESAYLAAAAYPLRQAAILILDLGLRPDEAMTLTKKHITDTSIIVTGKTGSRALPLTDRAHQTIQFLCSVFPDSEWLFPGRKGKHFGRKSLDNIHTKLRAEKGWPEEFVLYSFRHTYGTGLAESGASPFDIMKLMGHAKISTSQRYIHLRAEHLNLAAKRKEAYSKMLRGEEVHETDKPLQKDERQPAND